MLVLAGALVQAAEVPGGAAALVAPPDLTPFIPTPAARPEPHFSGAAVFGVRFDAQHGLITGTVAQRGTSYCPKTRTAASSSGFSVTVAEQSAQPLATCDGAFGRQRVELRLDDLVFQPLMVSFVMVMKNEM